MLDKDVITNIQVQIDLELQKCGKTIDFNKYLQQYLKEVNNG